MIEKKIINDATELVKNIPPTDEPVPESFCETEQPDISLTTEQPEVPLVPEYTIIASPSWAELIELVNTYMKEDWVTCWGVSVTQTSAWTRFYQAMERWKWANTGLNIPGLEDEPDLYEDA